MGRVALAVLTLAAAACAQQDAQRIVEAHARLAFGDSHRPGWVPVLVEDLRNLSGQDLDLELSVGWGDERPETVAHVSLPRQGMAGRRRLFLHAYDPSGHGSPRLFIRRRGEKKPLLDVWLAGSYVPAQAFLVISDGSTADVQLRAALNYNQSSTAYYYNTPTPLSCRTEDMPDRWVAYSQADLVILAGLSWDKVDDKAWKALVDWVRSGGTVLISPRVEAGWFKDPHLRDLCDPGEMEIGTADLSVSGLGPEKAVPFARWRDQEAFSSSDAPRAPFLGRYRTEFGHTVLLGTDITAQPYVGWRGLPTLWSTLIGTVSLSNPHDLMDRNQADPLVRRYYEREQGFPMRRVVGEGMRSLPGLWGVVLLVVGFVLIVGPINYLALKRLRRPLWTMWTIPGVSLLFVVFIVGMGYWTKGTNTAVQRVAFVDLVSGHDVAVEERYACVRAAAPGDHEVGWDPATQPRVLRPEETSYRIAQGAETAVRDLPLHMWEEAYLRGDAVRRVRGTVWIDHGPGGSMSVTNRSEWTIRAAVWVDVDTEQRGQGMGTFVRFGAIPPGASAKALDAPHELPVASRGAVVAEACGFGGLDRVVTEYLLDTRFVRGEEPPALFAFVDADPVPLTVTGRRPQERRTLTVLRVFDE